MTIIEERKDDRGRTVFVSQGDRIAVRVMGNENIELILFECNIEAMNPDDWDWCSDALYAPRDVVLMAMDSHGLNTTANDLRAKLDEALKPITVTAAEAGNLAVCYFIGTPVEITNQLIREVDGLRAQLAIANETIASLRQRDTVRPEALLSEYVRKKQFAAWNEGYEDGQDEMAHDYAKAVNPYGEP